FIEWGRDHSTAVFPVTLDFAISFLKPLAASKQCSAIRETLETFNFLQHVVGMKVEPGIIANPWVKGAVRGANIRTSDPRRSRVLTTSEVLLLETALIEGHHDRVDRYAIGAFLFQLYARARVSDLRNISKLELDLNDGAGFIEIRTYEHKNSRTYPPEAIERLQLEWGCDRCQRYSSQLDIQGKTQESYAREVQAQPLRDLVECIVAIRRGLFHPDRTRSGMVTQGALGSHFKFGGIDAHDFVCAPPSDSAPASAREPAPAEAPQGSPPEEAGSPTKDGEASSGFQDDVADPQSEESESSGDSEGDTVYENFGKGITQDAIPDVNMGPDLDIFQNPKTKSLHARAKGSTGKLICGRSLDNMKTFQGALNSFLAKKQGRSVRRDRASLVNGTRAVELTIVGKACGTMAQTLVESKAVFLERASRVGLPDEAVKRLVDQGIDTMSKLAFAPCQPGETPSEESLTGLIQTEGAEPSRGSIAAVRHLVFEAQTLLVSQTKALVENREAETKDLAPAERRERIKTQSQRLAGITMAGQSECSFASYDLCMKLLTENCVSYLAPSKCITREAELRADKPRKELDLQHSTLIVKEREPDQVCDTSTALSLHHALHRRSLALDLIGEPAAGSRATTVQQILLADRAAWLRLSELTPDGIRRDEAGRLPLDPLWKRLETDPKVIFHLLPREGSTTATAKRTGEHLGDSETPSPGQKQRKGKGKGKTKTQKEPANLPEELKGLSSWTKTGKRRCWGFNMQVGCANAKDDVDAAGVALEAAPATDQLPWHDTVFHHCQHGGQRAKLTRLRHNIPLMSELALLCPGESPEHRHLPWTRGPEGFATADEKVYPLVLCRRIADIVRRSVAAMGIQLPPLALEPGASSPAHEAQAAAGHQPAGKKLPPLVPEFRQVLVLQSPRPLLVGVRKLDTTFDIPADVSCTSAIKTLPAGTRVLRHSVVGHPGAAEDPCPAVDSSHDPLEMGPEEFSHYGLQLGTTATDSSWRESISHLCDLLRSDPLARGGLGSDELSWTCGAYTHANVVGLRKNTSSHPNVCKFLCEYVRRVAPGHPFTSIMLGRNLQGDVHIDKNNAVGLPNAVLKISNFDKGGIWVESPEGTVRCPSPNHPDALGEVIDFRNDRIFFSPDCRHCQAPWDGGPRIVLVAYTIRNFEKLGTEHGRRPSELGFCLPASELPTSPGNVGHPVHTDLRGRVPDRHILDGIPEETKRAVDQLASLSLSEIGTHRTEALRKWIGRARELEEQEEANRETMPQHCAKVLGRKRLVLFEEMLCECGHEDTSIARDIGQGFDLSGAIPRNPAVRAKRSTASLPESELRRTATVTREATLLATKSSGDPELDLALWEATQKEVDRGWLRGPVNPRSLDPEAVISRRFGIWQGDKCRPIDDFRASGVNATTSAEDSVTVHSADTIAASIAYRLKVDGKCRRYGGLEMKSYDLHKAYKNLPLSTGAVEIAYLSVYNPHKKTAEVFEQCVLPFGARASVHSFCRTSLGIWTAGVQILLLAWSVYYDDFVSCEVPPLTRISDLCAESLFRLLQWDTSPDKPTTFGSIAKVLGLEFDLGDTRLGRFYMRNTASRRDELRGNISSILEQGNLPRKECERLRGRLQFASNQIAGKRAGRAFKVLTKHLISNRSALGDDLKIALLFLRDCFLDGPPRSLNANILHLWHIYVDASCDDNKVGLGGVLVSEQGSMVAYFSEWAADELKEIVAPTSKNPIFEFECLAVLLAVKTWTGLISGCNLVIFSDNEGTKACLVKGSSDNEVGMAIVDSVHKSLDDAGCNAWFERVNTASNISDGPSRGEQSESLGVRFVTDATSVARSALVPWGVVNA
ncbi:ubiad1, partial [Symbiodinium necroappetens]